MVNKRVFLIVFFMALLPVAQANQELKLVIDKNEVQLGHHIDALLYGIDLQGNIVDIDLSNLRDNFGVNITETVDDAEDDRWPKKNIQLMQLKLHPRKIGQYSIPELEFGEAKSKAKNISVQQGFIGARDGENKISREVNISSVDPWEREPILVEVNITTTEAYASLQADSFTIPGFEITPFPMTSEKLNREGMQYTILKMSWALLPLISGQHIIDVPPIEFHKYGKRLRTYFSPKKIINVAPLPIYIPPTMPVGKVGISSQLKENDLLYPDTLYYWDVRLVSDGGAANWMPPVMSQINSTDEIHFFPKKSSREMRIEDNRLNSQVTHHIPFKPLENGVLIFPAINVQYFDPESGKIMTAIHQPQDVIALDLFWRITLSLLALSLLFIMSNYFYRKFNAVFECRKLRKAAFDNVRSADSVESLRDSLHSIAYAEGWPENLTIQQWLSIWTLHFKSDDRLKKLMVELSQSCYSKSPTDKLTTLKKTLLSCLDTRKRKVSILSQFNKRLFLLKYYLMKH